MGAPMNGRDLIAFNVRRIRVEQNVSQERLAFDAGVDRSYLGGLERGEANPTVDLLERIAETLCVPLIELFAAIEEGAERSDGLPKGRKPNKSN